MAGFLGKTYLNPIRIQHVGSSTTPLTNCLQSQLLGKFPGKLVSGFPRLLTDILVTVVYQEETRGYHHAKKKWSSGCLRMLITISTAQLYYHMGVSKNRGTPKSAILIGFSIINHPFWGTPIFGNTHILSCFFQIFCHSLHYANYSKMPLAPNPDQLRAQPPTTIPPPTQPLGSLTLGPSSPPWAPQSSSPNAIHPALWHGLSISNCLQ